MIDRTLRWLVLMTATMGLWRTEGLGAEPLPPRALARIGDHRFYHGPGITCVALSPDGRRAASAALDLDADDIHDKSRGAYDRLIVLWNAATGERLRELHLPQGPVSHLAFSPDGKRLAASYAIALEKSGVAFFDVETGKTLWRSTDFQADVVCLQFSADGKQLWVSEWSGPVLAYETVSGKQRRLWNRPPSTPSSQGLAGMSAVEGVLSSDGRLIIWLMCGNSGGGCPSVWMDGLHIYDAETNDLLYKKKFGNPDQESHHDDLNWSFAFTLDGKRLVADCNKLVVWGANTGERLASFKVPGMVRFALDPDGRRAAIEENNVFGTKPRLRLWNIETGKPLRDLISGIKGLEDGRQKMTPVFSTDGKTLLVATDSTLRFFDARTGEERSLPGHRAPVTPRFSADGRTLFTTCAEKRCHWNVSEKKLSLLHHEATKPWEVDCLAQSADGQLYLDWNLENCTGLRAMATSRVLFTLAETSRFADFSPDAKRLMLYDEIRERCSDIRLYDVKTGKKSGQINSETRTGRPVFSPDGRLVAWADCAGDIHLHDAATGKSVRTLRSSRPLPKGDIYPYFSLLFSPDGEQLIATNDLVDRVETDFRERIKLPLRVFQVSSGRQLACFYPKPMSMSKTATLSCMVCSPDGRLLAISEINSGVVRILEIASGKTRIEFAAHSHGVRGLAFSPDGKTLASGGEDNVVFLWGVTGAKTPTAPPERTIEGPTALWNDLASEDAKRAGVVIADLLRKPEDSVGFLAARLRTDEEVDEKRMARLIGDLDADTYAPRLAASRELFRLGERAEAAMRRELTNRPSLEVRKRIEDLLNKLEYGQLPPETLRQVRAIEVLEHLGTPAAQGWLEALAKGAPGARATREAKEALQRLADRK